MFAIWIQALTATAAPAAAAPFDLAVTVDDLPDHGALPPGMTRLGIARATLRALKAHHVPEAYGFVNAAELVRDPAGAKVLDAWRAAGYPLGNHTASHMSVDQAPSLAAWEADVVAGEPAITARMAGAVWQRLRFPYLATGATAERHDAAAAFLAARGYRIADVSLSFSDWAFSDAYARCRARHDQATIARMKRLYLAGVDRGIARMRAVSATVYRRTIPQVLLTHIGGWSALMLPAVLARLDAAGARYVPLDQAQADPAYAAAAAVPGGGDIMSRTAHAKGVDLAAAPAVPDLAEVDGFCR